MPASCGWQHAAGSLPGGVRPFHRAAGSGPEVGKRPGLAEHRACEETEVVRWCINGRSSLGR